MAVTKLQRRKRIKLGIRRKISGTSTRPRVSVFRSNKAIYAQVIDDIKGVTLAAVSSYELGKEKNNVEVSKEVGQKLAEKAKAAGIESVIFDRNGYPYHGKVKALAEGAREGGLKF
ncbi:50S ribosomal protein L18 [Marinoscillum furvescens]|uniref:Large ribosomal subunit protein uL18 n=1 Tax=Marinoscillum furvescens DSM 4134 TaxID=1122208 RepID=A0A3D9L3U3_MARFU|nr:50S ribosomal protein L18 [Marinoscillum furvescens]RED99480.1 large subunit ribosomal protein L18 [Marinoscillum furvescens DSM 4134]